MTKEEVVKLMESSRSELEWEANCDKVKASHGGDYPEFWFSAIIISGVIRNTSAKW